MDMDIYLSKRKKGSPKKKRGEPVEVVEVEEYEEKMPQRKRRSFFDRFLGFLSEESVEEISDGEFDEEFKEMEESSPGFFGRLFGWFSNDRDPIEDEIIEIVPPVNEDLKEALKIQNKWLKKLSGSSIKEFKESGDFERYKEILEKYDLIRKE